MRPSSPCATLRWISASRKVAAMPVLAVVGVMTQPAQLSVVITLARVRLRVTLKGVGHPRHDAGSSTCTSAQPSRPSGAGAALPEKKWDSFTTYRRFESSSPVFSCSTSASASSRVQKTRSATTSSG
jgi:hypothetical protein